MTSERVTAAVCEDAVVCIVGSHRSGTSLIAQLLKQSGVYLGSEDNLLGSNVGNQAGHYEHLGFIELNDAILKQLGGSWEFPPELQSGWERANSLEPLRCQARDLLQTFYGKSPWGWKDPRTTLLLPFWRSLIPNLRFIICIRSPLEVANSLRARNKMPLSRGGYLWERYLKASLADTDGCRRLVVFYDHFFKHPEREVAALLDFCNLRPSGPSAALAATVRGDLRHQRNHIAALLTCDEISIESKLLYLGLRGLGVSADDWPTHGSVSDKTLTELLRLLETPQHQLVALLQSRLNRSESELVNLRREIWLDAKSNHPWAYHFYRKLLRPFQLARVRSGR